MAIRGAAQLSAPEIGLLRPGEREDVLDTFTNDAGSWHLIRFGSTEHGYVLEQSTKLVSPDARVDSEQASTERRSLPAGAWWVTIICFFLAIATGAFLLLRLPHPQHKHGSAQPRPYGPILPPRARIALGLLAAATFGAAFNLFGSSYQFWTDTFLAFGLYALLVVLIVRCGDPAKDSWLTSTANFCTRFFPAVFAVSLMVAVATCNHFRQPETLKRDRAAPASTGTPISLALSGGGYRAALMHAGVFSALERLGVAISHIGATSGGSVIAAAYGLNINPKTFAEVVGRGNLNLVRDALGPLTLAGWMTGFYKRSDIHVNALNRLFYDGATMAEIRRPGPLLLLGTTDLITSDCVGVLSTGFIRTRLPRFVDEQFRKKPASSGVADSEYVQSGRFPGEEPLGRLVVASSSLPFLMNPIVQEIGDGNSTQRLVLSDGGLCDNTGLMLLIAASNLAANNADLKEWEVRRVLLSYGVAHFRRSAASEMGAFAAASRASEISFVDSATASKAASQATVRLVGPTRWLSSNAPEISADRAIRDSVERALSFISKYKTDRPTANAQFREWRALAEEVSPKVSSTGSESIGARMTTAVRNYVQTFVGIDTYETRFDPDTALDLYRLGVMSVLVEWPDIAPLTQ